MADASGTSFSDRFAGAEPEPEAQPEAESEAAADTAASAPPPELAAADGAAAEPEEGEPLEERPPDKAVAKKHARDRMAPVPATAEGKKARCFGCCCAPTGLYDTDLAQYGVGTWLYFRDLKRLAWLFLGMACIATPAALTHIGINGKEKEGCPNGNPAMCTMFGMLGNVPGPTDEIWEFGVGGGVLMGPDLFMFYSMTDAIYAIVLICMVAWWRKAQVIDVKAQDEMAVTMADFTVMVKGIPAATEKPGGLAGRMADVKVWLEKLVEELAQADGEKGGSVVEMTAGLAQAPLLKAYIERAKLYRDLLKLEGKHKKKPTDGTKKSVDEKRETFKQVDEQIADLANKAQDGVKLPALYVTFERAEDAERLVAAYAKFSCSTKPQLKYEGKKLGCKRAPEPSNVKWENLGIPTGVLLIRRSFTMCCSVAMLSVSAVLLYLSKKAKQAPPAPDCTSLVCSASLDLTAGAAPNTAQLMTSYSWDLSPFNMSCTTNATEIFFRAKAIDPTVVGADCADASAWCLKALSFDEMGTEDTVCADAIAANFENQAIMFLPILAVPLINAILKGVLRLLVRLEKQTSLSKESAAIASKLFYAQFLNTALLVFAISTKAINDGIQKANAAAGMADVPGGEATVSAAAREFEIQWYAETATAVFFTLLLNAAVPKVVAVIVVKCVGGLKRTALGGSKKNQLELNKLFDPPEFKMAEQYAQMLNTCFCTLFFCTGMPLLLHVAALDLALTFVADRWLFYHGYHKPPQFDESLARQASSLMYWAAPLHLVMACWTFTADFVQSGDLGLWEVDVGAGEESGGFGWLAGRALGRVVGMPPLLVLLGWILVEVLSYPLVLGWILPIYKKLSDRNKIAPEQQFAPREKLPSEAERIVSLGFTKAVRHIANYGEPTYQLKGNALYADAFESIPPPESFQTWRGSELQGRLTAISDGTIEAEGPLLSPRKGVPAPAPGASFPPSPTVIRALSSSTWEAAGGWRDPAGWVYALSIKFDAATVAGPLTGLASWTLKAVPEEHAAAYGSKIGQTDTEHLNGSINAEMLALDGDPKNTPDISPSTVRLVLCQPEVQVHEEDEDGVLAKVEEARLAAGEAETLAAKETSRVERAALLAELKGNISGTKVRLVRVTALPAQATLSPRDVTAEDVPSTDYEPAAQP